MCRGSILASHPSAPGPSPIIPKIFQIDKLIDVAEFNQRLWLEESGQWLENVVRTHLVLASDKPVLQKKVLGRFVIKLLPARGLKPTTF